MSVSLNEIPGSAVQNPNISSVQKSSELRLYDLTAIPIKKIIIINK